MLVVSPFRKPFPLRDEHMSFTFKSSVPPAPIPRPYIYVSAAMRPA